MQYVISWMIRSINCASLAKAVALHDGHLTFGSDAHISSRVGGFDECIALIENIGIPKEKVLNYNASDFLKFIQKPNKKLSFTDFKVLFENGDNS